MLSRYEEGEASTSCSNGERESCLFNDLSHSFTLSVDESIEKVFRKITDAEAAKNFDACLILCSQAMKMYPENIQIALLKAKFLVLTSQLEAANTILHDILINNTQNAEAIATLGLVFYHQGNLKKSVEVFSNALQISKQLHETAILRKNAKRFLQIIEQIPGVEVASIYPNSSEKKPKFIKFSGHVMNLIEEGLQLDETNREIMKVLRFKQGFGNFLNERYQTAIENFTEALNFDETNVEMFMLRALSYIAVFFLDDAMIDLLEAEKLSGNECRKTTSGIRFLRKGICKVYVSKTNYDFLDISRNATEAEIALSFKSLSLLHQVKLSKVQTDAEKRKQIFKYRRIENAYAILSNKNFKKQYDRHLKRQEIEIECPTLRACCTTIGNCYQCCCVVTGSCIGESFMGIGNCLYQSCNGITSCCCSETCLRIMCDTLKCCNIIVAIFILLIFFGIFYLIF